MNAQQITTPGDLYAALIDATTPAERDHHASDLYIMVTPTTTRIIDRYAYRSQVETFRDQTDPRRALWYAVPFAYVPYWTDHRL